MLRRSVVVLLAAWAVSAPAQDKPALNWKQHIDAGMSLEDGGQYAAAKQQYTAGLQLVAGFKDNRELVTQMKLGVLAASMGQYVEAEEWDNKAVRLGLELYGSTSAELAIPFINLAALYREQGQPAKAENYGRRALSLLGEPHDSAALVRAKVLGTLGGILSLRGELTEAESMLRESTELARRIPPPSDILSANLNNLAGVYAKTQRPAEALAAYREAYDLVRAASSNDPNLFYILAGMAGVEAGSGHYEQAVADLESGIRLADEGGAGNTMQVRDALAAEANWLTRLNRKDEARRVREREKRVAEVTARNSYSQQIIDASQVAKSVEKRRPEVGE